MCFLCFDPIVVGTILMEQERGMNKSINRHTVWISIIAGILGGALLKPIILPSGFAAIHGMGPMADLALGGIGFGVALIAYALLSRHGRMRAAFTPTRAD
nr:MAG: hypothetical protein E4H34_01675 [Hyphomicrobiales bacterium]